LCLQRGETALSGKEEQIPSHRFPPDDTRDRIIFFRGEYISIYNEQTEHQLPPGDDVTEYAEYKIPRGYTCEVINATVFFKA
jgi:hypothetical protein